jgi:2-keto-4-pentenoate hydratase/2-oxohepta-3-ene-1,7-dioic acid hydratase in catechol pathway
LNGAISVTFHGFDPVHIQIPAQSVNRPSKIVCVGRNYLEHARELGNQVPEQPLIFFKPPSSIVAGGEAIVLPPESGRVEHEGEIAVVIGRTARRVKALDAWDYVAGIAPLNDVTARDLQKTDGQWTRAKGFDTFCPLGAMVSLNHVADRDALEVICRVNGEVRQHGRVSEMAFDIPTLIEYISGVMTLEPGDVIATGTPAGVGPLQPGDVVEVEIPGVGTLSNLVQSS